MFRDIPQSIEVTQGHLKALEAWRVARGMERMRLLRQISPDALLCLSRTAKTD